MSLSVKSWYELLTCQLVHDFSSLLTTPMKHALIYEYRKNSQPEPCFEIGTAFKSA